MKGPTNVCLVVAGIAAVASLAFVPHTLVTKICDYSVLTVAFVVLSCYWLL
jgi:hypothetical protein